ncbi:hypothetical protein HN51_054612 [Arachis hypogaea]
MTRCRELRRLEIECQTALPVVGASLPNGPFPTTMKMLQKLQSLDLASNGLQGSSANEICEI